MRALCLPLVAELADRLRLAVGDEDRVVAEAAVAAWLERDAAGDDPGAPKLFAVRRDRDELGDVPRATVVDALELAQQLRDRRSTLGCVACRRDAGPAAERGNLDARVLADRPPGDVRAPEDRLGARIRVIRVPGLGRIVVRVEGLDRPAGKQHLELARLVRVARAEACSYSLQRTSTTPSMSPTAATITGAETPCSSTSTAISRRSPSCAISSDTTRPPRCSITSSTGTGLPPAGISTSRRSISGR